MYPCPDPNVCGVLRHRSMRSCKVLESNWKSPRSRGSTSPLSTPSLARDREDLDVPSVELFWNQGTIRLQEWRNPDGWLHRENGPAMIEYNQSGNVVREEYRVDGEFQRLIYHRILFEKEQEYHLGQDIDLGTLEDMNTYSLLKYCHRDESEGPAYTRSVKRYVSGETRLSVEKKWMIRGKLHRDNGPASNTDGIEEWYQNGVRHREDGPALTYPGGSADRYYIHGQQLSKEEYEQYIEARDSGFTDEMSRAWAGL